MRMHMPALLRDPGAAQGSMHRLQRLSPNAKGHRLQPARYIQLIVCQTRSASMHPSQQRKPTIAGGLDIISQETCKTWTGDLLCKIFMLRMIAITQ